MLEQHNFTRGGIELQLPRGGRKEGAMSGGRAEDISAFAETAEEVWKDGSMGRDLRFILKKMEEE